MKTAIITGTSSGIGFHMAHALCADGWQVYGVMRDETRFEAQLRLEGLAEPEGFHRILADINDRPALTAALEGLPSADLLVNNAGYGLYGPLEDLTEEEFRRQFETNFFSALALIRLVLPEMRRRGTGRILNITSILGTMAIPTGSAYCSSKWALEAATQALRYELSPLGIEVCAVEPGLVRTRFKANLRTPGDDGPSSYGFLNRLVSANRGGYGPFTTAPETAARAVVRLLRRRRLPARYRLGLDASFYHALQRCLPASWIDALIRGYVTRLHRVSGRFSGLAQKPDA